MQLKIAAKTEGRVFGLANNGAFSIWKWQRNYVSAAILV